MNTRKMYELLMKLKLIDKIDETDREASILKLLEEQLDKYVTLDDEEMQEILHEAIEYQEGVIEQWKTSVVIKSPKYESSEDEYTEMEESRNQNPNYSDRIKDLKDKNANTVVSTTSKKQSNPLVELWFTSQKGNDEVNALFEEIESAIQNNDFQKASQDVDLILDQEPRNAGAYLALYLAKHKISNLKDFFEDEELSFDKDNHLIRTREYATTQQLNFIDTTLKEHHQKTTYMQAEKKKLAMDTSAKCAEAATLFESLGDYKDAKEKAAYCRQKESKYLAEEAETKKKLSEREKIKTDTSEMEQIQNAIAEKTTLSEDELKGYIEQLITLRKEYPDYASSLDDTIAEAKKKIQNIKKVAHRKANLQKVTAFSNTVYVVVLVILIYLGTSPRFIISDIVNGGYDYGVGAKAAAAVSSIYSLLPVSPFLTEYYLKNSLTDTITSFHELEKIVINNSDIKTFNIPNNEVDEVYYINSPAKDLEVSVNARNILLKNSPKVETLLVKSLNAYEGISIHNCEKLKQIEVLEFTHEDGSRYDTAVRIYDCNELEKIILPENIDYIEFELPEKGYPEIISDNPNLNVKVYITTEEEVVTIQGKENQNLYILMHEKGDTKSSKVSKMTIEGVNAVRLGSVSLLKELYLEEGIKRWISTDLEDIKFEEISGSFSENKIGYFQKN